MERDSKMLGLEDRRILEILREKHPEVFLNIKREVASSVAPPSHPSRAASPCAAITPPVAATPRSPSPLSRAASDAASIHNAVCVPPTPPSAEHSDSPMSECNSSSSSSDSDDSFKTVTGKRKKKRSAPQALQASPPAKRILAPVAPSSGPKPLMSLIIEPPSPSVEPPTPSVASQRGPKLPPPIIIHDKAVFSKVCTTLSGTNRPCSFAGATRFGAWANRVGPQTALDTLINCEIFM
ncbi:unnamed protein product [Leptosia nina]|uniref:Uncharacterized protein n=1 Tax=Leptosia nina TaxID=320188 RepID=A0AAV1IWA6_9NEOP